MALIGGVILEELVKDVIIPWWITSEVIAGTAAVVGTGVAVAVEESKAPNLPNIPQII